MLVNSSKDRFFGVSIITLYASNLTSKTKVKNRSSCIFILYKFGLRKYIISIQNYNESMMLTSCRFYSIKICYLIVIHFFLFNSSPKTISKVVEQTLVILGPDLADNFMPIYQTSIAMSSLLIDVLHDVMNGKKFSGKISRHYLLTVFFNQLS